MEAVFGGLVVLLIVYSIVAFTWGLVASVFKAFRGDRTPAFQRAYRHQDSAGVDSSDAGE